MGAFVKDQGVGQVGDVAQGCLSAATFGGQEAHKEKGVGGQATTDQGADSGRGSRNGGNGDTRLHGRLYQFIAGVGETRHSCIGDERHIGRGQLVQQVAHSLRVAVFVVAHQRGGDVVMFEELPCVARVFGRYQAHLPQNP